MEQLFGSASLISVLVSLTALAGFVYSRSKAAREQGVLEEKVSNLKESIDQAWEAIHKIEHSQNNLAKAFVGFEAKLESIDGWLQRIDSKLEARA